MTEQQRQDNYMNEFKTEGPKNSANSAWSQVSGYLLAEPTDESLLMCNIPVCIK